MPTLTNLDSAFLHLETCRTPMHVGGVLLFAHPGNGRMTFARFRQHLASRLQTAPVFRQRLYVPPAMPDVPQWIEDAAFCLDNHLQHRVVRGPLTSAPLDALAGTFFSTTLRRDRPLWEMVFVTTAKAADGFAVLLKVHHAALDGVSAEAVITGLLDPTEQPRVLPADDWRPAAPPASATLLRQRVAALRQAPAQARLLLTNAAMLFYKRAVDTRFRPLPNYFRAPPTPFNVPVDTADRVHAAVQLSLPRVKAIRGSRPGLTVNDVVLAICAGATRRYLAEGNALPAAPLVAMAPVSRRPADAAAGGNQVSAMLVALATDIADPLARLQRIHDNVQLAKACNREIPVDTLLERLPAAAPALALSLFARTQASRHLPPIFNMVVTNVPGSPVPLYLDGARLLAIRGMAGVYDGMGLTFVVMSYVDQLSIAVTTTRDAVRRPALLLQYLAEAADELAAAALPDGAPAASATPASATPADAGVAARSVA